MIALRNITRKKTRSILTALGAAVGIMMLASLTSVSQGLTRQIEDTMGGYEVDLAVQSTGAPSPFGSKISSADYEALSQVEGVDSVSSMVIGAIDTSFNSYFLVMGVAPVQSFAGRLSLVDGSMLETGKHHLLLGRMAAQAAGRRVGDQISLADNESYAVTGVYSSGSAMLDNAAVIDIGDAQRILNRGASINLAFVSLKQGVPVEEAADLIEARLPGLAVIRSGDFAGQISLIQVANSAAWAISLIALVGACIVVMNTLVMAVSERTKEIGILMAIGWSRARVMRTIIWESLIICFIGGVIGSLVGVALVWSLRFVHPAGLWLWTSAAAAPRIVLISLGVSLLLGLLSSLYPAFLSTRLLPAEALRHE